jgi:hypothetical protein
LLGAMYLQMAWRIKSRQCGAPGCNNIIGMDERSDKIGCSKACGQSATIIAARRKPTNSGSSQL